MPLTVAQIAAQAFDAVAAKITGPIQTCTLSRAGADYDPTSGDMAAGSPGTETGTGRCVWASESAVADVFPHLEISDADALVYAIELTLAPREGDTFAAGGRTGQVLAVRDILTVGELYAMVIR